MPTDYEQKLLQRLGKGEEKAFRELFDAYYPKVRAFVGCIVKRTGETDDIAQDIFAKIWERREQFCGGEFFSFNGYIYRMARNAALNAIRRKANIDLSQLPDADAAGSDDASPEEAYYAREKELFIKLIVCQMPEQRRRIFEMSRYMGMDNQTIAQTLHLSKKTVENHLTLALKQLRNALALFSIFFVMN